MKRHDIYYLVKPAIPRGAQIAARRIVAAHKRKKHKAVWPIDPSAFRAPDNWRGWPDQKRFALVLHHDVDTLKGVENCARLMALEKDLNFRSAFYFVAEDYPTPRDLRLRLADSGFEIGVHGLSHDGKLFKSPSRFSRMIPRIDYCLKEWGAVGFTSPSMLRNHSLMAELDIEHGCSSFDTDPFEPHNKGTGTIFPFYALNVSGTRDYVELPYTLPQDHALFVILREKDNGIWKDKLDWIAAHGGMALVNTHPDYMEFNGSALSREEYPISYYADFLEYVRSKYAGQYWHPLPREMARFWRTAMPRQRERQVSAGARLDPSPPRRGGKIWIDIDNTPHVPFFIPIISELERRGYQVLLTGRDAYQVCELAREKGLRIQMIGRHYGKNKVMKAIGLLHRSVQLFPFWLKHRPDIALSHGGRSQFLLCNILHVPTILIMDYEYARVLPFDGPRWIIVPEVLPTEGWHVPFTRVRRYPGIKEDAYVPGFEPDPAVADELGLEGEDIIISVRPPADEAHYHNSQSDDLMTEMMSRIGQSPGVKVILLPRNLRQKEQLQNAHPEWFQGSRVIVPARVLDGLSVLWYSDLVVSGGGTMNREAAALGVPVYSIFRGEIGAVDKMLEEQRRLIMIQSPPEVWTKIKLEKRTKGLPPEKGSRPALAKILFSIENIVEIERAKRRRSRKANVPKDLGPQA